ncbi:MAG: adenosine-specific kinase [Thermodesulfobacteriota bacterium]|nr:adenosine-specific kinase [Thermodesulfobacteriota bacterium]
MELEAVKINFPEGCNIILGQAHFIKTIEDIYEIMNTTIPNAKFGVAFSEASGPCLIRFEGNDKELEKVACDILQKLSAGHVFVIVMKEGYPINVLPMIRMCQEVCSIFCATANPVEIIVAETNQGRGILGVIDGSRPQGIEDNSEKQKRKEFLRTVRYKC